MSEELVCIQDHWVCFPACKELLGLREPGKGGTEHFLLLPAQWKLDWQQEEESAEIMMSICKSGGMGAQTGIPIFSCNLVDDSTISFKKTHLSTSVILLSTTFHS